METAIDVEENLLKANANLDTKSAASLIKIESIIIDLINTKNVIDVEKCNHFSIRGYVSKVRRGEWNKCCPISVSSIHYSSEKQNNYPPLDVPNFRWWSCQTCLRRVGAKGILNEAFRSMCSGSLENHKPDMIDPEVVNVTQRSRSHRVNNNVDVLKKVLPLGNCSSRHPHTKLDECEYLSSENADILLGAESGSSHRRKARKVRMLKELLGKNGDKRNILNIQSSPKIAPADASARNKSFPTRQGLVAVPGNFLWRLGVNKKRKFTEDGYNKFMEMSSPNSAFKKFKSFNKGKGADAVLSSGLDDALIGAGPEIDARSHLVNLQVVEGHATRKKKKKTIQGSGERESGFFSKYEVDACSSHEVCFDLNNKRTFRKTSFPDEKLKRHAYQTEFGSSSLLQQSYHCATSNSVKSVANQKSSHILRKQSNEQAEIIFDKEEIYLLQGECAGKPNPLPKSGWIDINKGDNIGSSKQKSAYYSQIDVNQYNMGQSEQSCIPTGFNSFTGGREKPLNGVEHFDTSSSRHGSPQNCQLIGNMDDNGWKGAPHHKAAHVWPSMLPNGLKCPSNIMKSADVSTNKDRYPWCPNLERQGRKCDSVTFRSTPSCIPVACKHNRVGSLDPCSHETIPAMHLLNLMNAGFQSGPSVDLNVKQILLQRASFLHNYRSDEFPSMTPGGCRAVSSIKHPKSAFPVQLSVKSQEKEKRNWKSEKTMASSGGLSTTCSVHSMPKMILGADKATRNKFEAQVMASKSGAALNSTEICSINRNPGDFSVPEAGNPYMIRGEDLKFGWSFPSAKRKGLLKPNSCKRQRKLAVAKERP